MDLIVTEAGIHCAREDGLQRAADTRGAAEFAAARILERKKILMAR
jgi:hypothetical protein